MGKRKFLNPGTRCRTGREAPTTHIGHCCDCTRGLWDKHHHDSSLDSHSSPAGRTYRQDKLWRDIAREGSNLPSHRTSMLFQSRGDPVHRPEVWAHTSAYCQSCSTTRCCCNLACQSDRGEHKRSFLRASQCRTGCVHMGWSHRPRLLVFHCYESDKHPCRCR